MRINPTYKIISALLCSAFLFGIIAPVSSHAGMMEHCSTMNMHETNSESTMHDHMEMNDSKPMNHHPVDSNKTGEESCGMTFDCDCYYTSKAVRTEAPVLQKIKIPKLILTSIDASLNLEYDQYFPPPIWLSSSYSPPLLFLANESFLI